MSIVRATAQLRGRDTARGTRAVEDDHGQPPKVLSNLVSLLETGAIALLEPYPKAS